MGWNVFYFMRRWARRDESGVSERALSVVESLANMGHKVFVVSADPRGDESQRDLEECPVELVHVVEGKESASLGKAGTKPDLAIFDCPHTEQAYSALLFNKWNKCPRLLQLHHPDALLSWRAQNYPRTHLCAPRLPLYSPANLFHQDTLRSILRSDFLLCPNDFLFYLLLHSLKASNTGLINLGYPLQQYRLQATQLQYRPFDARQHFVFLANLYEPRNIAVIRILIDEIWPELGKKAGCELHIYGKGFNKELLNEKAELGTRGIKLMGQAEDISVLEKYRVFLDPTRVGGGTRNKILQSWFYHTPVVTTPVGAEGFFLQTLDSSFTASDDSGLCSGFLAERVTTSQQKEGESKILSYYSQNILSDAAKTLSFGGSCANLSFSQFCQSALELYKDKNKWEKAVKIGEKIIMKNQGEEQMEINLKQAFTKMESSMHLNRLSKPYSEEWTRYLKSKEQLTKNKK